MISAETYTVELEKPNKFVASVRKFTLEEAHVLLGHVSDESIVKSIDMIQGFHLDTKSRYDCVTCKIAKSQRKPHPQVRHSSLAAKIGDLIHCDILVYSRPTNYSW